MGSKITSEIKALTTICGYFLKYSAEDDLVLYHCEDSKFRAIISLPKSERWGFNNHIIEIVMPKDMQSLESNDDYQKYTKITIPSSIVKYIVEIPRRELDAVMIMSFIKYETTTVEVPTVLSELSGLDEKIISIDKTNIGDLYYEDDKILLDVAPNMFINVTYRTPKLFVSIVHDNKQDFYNTLAISTVEIDDEKTGLVVRTTGTVVALRPIGP